MLQPFVVVDVYMKAAFLDRDGVINAESSAYVTSLAEFDLIPGSIDAISRFTKAGWQTFVVTNQSSVARKMITLAGLEEIHQHLIEVVEQAGGRINAIYFCPHGPGDGCKCRKPWPGMLLKAQTEFQLDLAHSAMIGDSLRDMQAANYAGCGCKIVVQTGYGQETVTSMTALGIEVDYVAEDLADAATWLLATFPDGISGNG